MSNQPDPASDHPESRQRTQRILAASRIAAAGVVFVVLSTLILVFPVLPVNRVQLQSGQVATEDILSPRRITYISEIETAVASEAAAASIPDVYDPADARVGRQQVLYARQIMEFVNTVRHDTLATSAQQRDALAAINGLSLQTGNVETLLTISDGQFDAVSGQITAVLADVMSGEVREGRLDEVSEGLLLRVSVDLPEEYGPLVADVVEDLLLPNSVFNAELTEQEREAARDALVPVEQTFASGEVVVRAGEVVTEGDIEALQHLGLLQNRIGWREVASALIAVLVSTTLLMLYAARFQPDILTTFKNQVLVGGLFIFFLAGGRLMVPEGAIIPYLFPAAALAFILRALYNANLALFGAVILGGLTGIIATGSLELATYAAVGGIIAAISLRRADRINRFFLVGVFVGVSQTATLFVFRLTDSATDTLGILQLTAAALFNGLFSAGVALAGLFVIGPLFRVTTALSLIELERPDHQLLLRLQREAPGTYQHSLQVRNLAEAAAEAIGANSQLVRVGTLYHDVGKLLRPAFFIENRVEGTANPHETLDPVSSADLIVRHVKDGLDLTRRYHVPARIRDFVAEHHGTTIIRFFYYKAVEQAGGDESKVNEAAFRYPGPRPQSRETAILMLSDACESAVRANQPRSEEEIATIVGKIIQQRLDGGELDDSGLTLTDLQVIRRTIVGRLKGVYHPRIRYPGDEPKPDDADGDGQPDTP